MVLAGVDIGTLTCRLLIARVSETGRLQELRSERRILRLGEGLDRDDVLLPSAMSRVIATLREWRRVIDTADVKGEVAVATHAVRQARNRDEFLARIIRETGFEVEIIGGEEEARRTMLGIRHGLSAEVSSVLGLDIGGGSTEFVYDCPGRVPVVHSIELGVVRLTETVLTHDPPTSDEVATARELIRKQTAEAQARLGDVGDTLCVGTAGTITTLAAMAQQLPSYQAARIHNYRLSLDAVRDLEEDLLRRTHAQRQGFPGLEPGREDVIAAGTLILRGTMETFGFADILVSDLGLREGIVLDLAARLGRPVTRDAS
ncbi:MAG: hypothetical protein V3U08_01620 [Nitrospirales bacterium]